MGCFCDFFFSVLLFLFVVSLPRFRGFLKMEQQEKEKQHWVWLPSAVVIKPCHCINVTFFSAVTFFDFTGWYRGLD